MLKSCLFFSLKTIFFLCFCLTKRKKKKDKTLQNPLKYIYSSFLLVSVSFLSERLREVKSECLEALFKMLLENSVMNKTMAKLVGGSSYLAPSPFLQEEGAVLRPFFSVAESDLLGSVP